MNLVQCTLTVCGSRIELQRQNMNGRITVKRKRFADWAAVIDHMTFYGPLVVWRVRVGGGR